MHSVVQSGSPIFLYSGSLETQYWRGFARVGCAKLKMFALLDCSELPLRPVARCAVDNAAARGRRGQRCALTPDRPPPAHALPTAPLHRGARPPEPPAALRTAQLLKIPLKQPNSPPAFGLRGFALPFPTGRQMGGGSRVGRPGHAGGGPARPKGAGGIFPRRGAALGGGRDAASEARSPPKDGRRGAGRPPPGGYLCPKGRTTLRSNV